MEKEVRFTYRCTADRAMRIKGLKEALNMSFQRMVHECVEGMLWKYQHDGEYFRDLPSAKKLDYVAEDIIGVSSLSQYYKHKREERNG